MPEHSPFPTPERAIYGFVLYLTSFVMLGLYLVWAYVPDTYLYHLGLSFFPHKIWAIAVPCFAVFSIVLLLISYVGLNYLVTPHLESYSTVTDIHSKEEDKSKLKPGAIPPLRDIPISKGFVMAQMESTKERVIMVNTLTCLLRAMEGWCTTVELRNENTVRGKVESVDYRMNTHMSDCVFTKLDGSTMQFDSFYVQGKNIRFVHIPDEMNIMRAIMGQVKSFNSRFNKPVSRVDYKKRKLLKKIARAQNKMAAKSEGNETSEKKETTGKNR